MPLAVCEGTQIPEMAAPRLVVHDASTELDSIEGILYLDVIIAFQARNR